MTRMSDGRQRSVWLWGRDIFLIDRDVVAKGRALTRADIYISQRVPSELSQRGGKLYLCNRHDNVLTVFYDHDDRMVRVGRNRTVRVDNAVVRFCPLMDAPGVEGTDLRFEITCLPNSDPTKLVRP